jgi:hypothetical protein
MGGGGSRPAPPPTVVEQDPPAGSGESSIVYADRPETPRLDGLTRTIANECNGCKLEVKSGISSSSVKLSREFGEVTDVQCKRYRDDKKRVTDKKMSFQDFLGNVKAGKYLRNLDNGYCEQVTMTEEDAKKFKNIGEFDENKLQSVRIQKVSSGGFSSDTKAKLTPSIPFKLTFNGQEITVKTMTVYHPCPLRIEGIQPDAVLSLNDPGSDDGSQYIILIPLTAKNTADPSIEFFDRILPQVNALMVPEATGQYMTRNVATGANWSLTKVFTTGAINNGSFEVQNGYYEWKGMPALERVKSEIYNAWTNQSTISYSWKESGKPSPRYIMLDTPVAISSSSLSSITQTLPVTPASDAVHAVLYSSNPLQRGIVHKQGPPNPACPRENFADMNGVKEDFCDDWTAWAQDTKTTGYTTQQIFTLIFNVLVFIAMGVGTYLAFSAILRLYDIELKNVSAGLGKITAVVFKSLKQKVGEMKGMTSGLGGLLALSRGKPISQDEIAKLQANPAALAKIEEANPDTSAAAEAKAAEDAEAKAAALKKKAEDEAAALKKKAEDEAAKAAEEVAAAKEAAKAATEKTDKENAAKALAAAKQASEDKKAAAQAAAEAERKRKEEEAEAERKRKEEEAEAERKRKEEEAEADKKAEEVKTTDQPKKKVSSSIAERQQNFSGTSYAPTKENAYKLGTLKKGQGRTKPGRGRVGSTRRAVY